MKILLSDGAGVTSRQVATILGRRGHTVDVLDASGFALTHLTRWVHHVHKIPPFGDDPIGWLDAAVPIIDAGGYDVLLPVQEQVAVLARQPDRVRAGLPVPRFASLARVQDKIAATRTLTELRLPQPASTVATTTVELLAAPLPCFVKQPIGTASSTVTRAETPAHLQALGHRLGPEILAGGVLAQQPAHGPLIMVQAVFNHGQLLAWHANLRTREGAEGGASHKHGIPAPEVGAHLATLGGGLDWHGALSLDAIQTDRSISTSTPASSNQ